jgi:hypothetical protein
MNTTTETQLTLDLGKEHQTLITIQPDLSMTFHDGKNAIGKLDWNDGTMKFSGSVDESAQLFFDCIIQAHTQDTLFEQKKNNTEWKS